MRQLCLAAHMHELRVKSPTHSPLPSHRYKTAWDKINVDSLTEEGKRLGKEVKALPKGVRNYEVYRLLEESIRAMLTSLPLVQVRVL